MLLETSECKPDSLPGMDRNVHDQVFHHADIVVLGGGHLHGLHD